eukprot:CAMPEP_0117623008 /NCGR_PEP_ID=MMETSP0784-20121206/88430_1 /TAXON_ID=39447 /ORGANISM="" /LENGTH=52 /DNA_ID=CAMNT_0005426955 /DNA_START=595 /DNA_END=749 /DNA_ORIENTATION=-
MWQIGGTSWQITTRQHRRILRPGREGTTPVEAPQCRPRPSATFATEEFLGPA